jgi:hypothetical protein
MPPDTGKTVRSRGTMAGFGAWRLVLLASAMLIPGLLTQDAIAEKTFTISGYVRDEASNEELIGASVVAVETGAGVSANAYGFYALTLPAGVHTIRFGTVGYAPKEVSLDLTHDMRLDVVLTAQAIELDSIVVTSERERETAREVEMGSVKLSPAQVRSVPILFGEQDVLKTIQLMPGVQESSEGNTGFYVRGGTIDQNLVLLDEATVFNPGHMLGFFSVFNSDAIKDVKLIKGLGPAEYGGRLSSVLDIKMKEGNSKEFQGQAGIGLIASRLAVEGPIVRDRSSFIVSGRRTYFDLFLKGSSDPAVRKTQIYFYDLNAKANYHLGANDRIFLSGYFGKDLLGYKGEFGIDWGNATGTARWNHIFSNRLFLNSSLIYSHYSYKVGITNGDELLDISSSINTFSVKEDFNYFAALGSTFKFGGQTAYHTFIPGEIAATESAINELRIKRKYALESALYGLHEWTATPRLSLDYGLRVSSFTVLGPGDDFVFDDDGLPISVTSYESGDVIKHYAALEPRATARLMLNDESSVKASFTRNRQYLHLLSTSTTTTPFDLWHPSTRIVKPGTADQYAVGYFRSLKDDKYDFSAELYYRDLRDQIDYKNGADIYFNEYVESQLVFGKARAYGLELLFRKNLGRLTGWLSYTLARTEKRFDAINDGAWFRARQDRTHDLKIIGQYQLNPRWTLGVNWVYYTGNAVTFPSGKYIVDGHVINLYTERNGYRMPAYHRLDVAFTYRRVRSSWNFSLFNAYGRRNAYAIEFRQDEDDPTKTEAVRIALFRFFPSVTYNLWF